MTIGLKSALGFRSTVCLTFSKSYSFHSIRTKNVFAIQMFDFNSNTSNFDFFVENLLNVCVIVLFTSFAYTSHLRKQRSNWPVFNPRLLLLLRCRLLIMLLVSDVMLSFTSQLEAPPATLSVSAGQPSIHSSHSDCDAKCEGSRLQPWLQTRIRKIRCSRFGSTAEPMLNTTVRRHESSQDCDLNTMESLCAVGIKHKLEV